MTEATQLDEALFQEAVDLMIHWQTGRHDPAVMATVEHWCRQSPRHQKIWAELTDIHQLAGEALAQPASNSSAVAPISRLSSRRYSRRQVLWGSAAAMAAVGVSAALGPKLLLQARADFTTDTAQIQKIPFGEGTTIVLGPDSAINCRVTNHGREVELLAGLAYFDVVPHAGLPLHISSHGLDLQTAGGQFDISQDAGFIRTMVSQGSLDVTHPITRDQRSSYLLTAGDWLTLDSQKEVVTHGRGDAQQVAVWRDGLIVADNEPLGAVISRIGRWQPGKVVITHPTLAAQRVNGLYHLDNPIEALRAAVQPYGGNVHSLSPWLTVITRA